ncbi:MAG: SLC13 family permease [Akkermansiaceae bacterium]|nr:SLC13 family permease [Akkermansiaceae bacterium]
MGAIEICLMGLAVVIVSILWLRLHAFLGLLLGAFVVSILTPGVGTDAMSRVAEGFGTGCRKIGILIALAAIIGQCLLASGAAERIVRGLLSLFGVKRAPMAFLGSGFVLGIPVFFDTVFYLMLPLVRAFSRTNPKVYLLALLSVVAGASMAHSLVPPTPGPLLVAARLEVSLGVLIPAGLILGVVTISVGYGYARWANANFGITYREIEAPEIKSEEKKELPGLGWSLMPILSPLVLISLRTFLEMRDGLPAWLEVVSGKNVAMALGAGMAMVQATKYCELKTVINEALSSGGVIILITAAGAAFGAVLKDTGIGAELSGMVGSGGGVLLLAFVLTALVRFAQGSATVAMITAVGIVAPMVLDAELGFHAVYVALAIGCGSKPLPWMNDSGFWIVSKMSGMNEVETLKTFSVMLSLMGLVGFAVVWLASLVMPMN